MANNLQIANLDFDQIKTNLKQYLQGQSEFTDYDFEGSGLSVLLDILAYNTHYNAFYVNMALNELFIDTAVKRESVVSLAKLLNYTPRSIRTAQATIDLFVNGVEGGTGGTPLTLDRFTPFTSEINQETFTFYNLESITIDPNGAEYSYSGLNVYEGVYVANKFTVVSPGPAEKYVIPNKNIDTTTIRVTVQDNPEATFSTTYTKFDGDITQVTGASRIYYIDQNAQGLYEIYFGDGILGYKLGAGNRVTIEYLVSSGTVANVSDKAQQTMSLAGSLSAEGVTYESVDVTVTSKSNTAQEEETIDEIRFNAPKSATSQNRLVTKYDYEAFLRRNYNYIDAVSIWGGEDNDPPQYGRIFISIVPKQTQFLTTTRKNTIASDLKSRGVMVVTPQFVDPDTFYLTITSTVKYNPNITNKTAADIQDGAVAAVQTYFTNNLGSFENYFSFSKMISDIDASDTSILGNQTSFVVEKRIFPTTGSAFSQRINLNNRFIEHEISSTQFFYNIQGTTYSARIKDVPDAATVSLNGTYKRAGTIVTLTFTEAHNLTVGETVTLSFSGAIPSGSYTINTVIDDKKLTVITPSTGVTSGTVSLESEARGKLIVYDVNSAAILNNNIGFVSYNSGIIQIRNLNIFGFLSEQTDLRIYFKLTEDSKDITTQRNQIIRLSQDAADSATNRLAGLVVSTIAVPR